MANLKAIYEFLMRLFHKPYLALIILEQAKRAGRLDVHQLTGSQIDFPDA